MTSRALPPLVAHVVFRFDVGGLENGVVNLLNRLPRQRFRHAVVALTEVTAFRERVQRSDVEFIALHKPPGQGFKVAPRLFSLFRRLRPDIVHTRNLAALEATLPARLAGVPIRIHGEHGRDIDDLDGSSRRYQLARRIYRPFVTHYVALSNDLQRYLRDQIGVPAYRITKIINGVDVDAFHPGIGERSPLVDSPFQDDALFVFGAVGRLQAVKNQTLFAQAFVRMLEFAPALRHRARIVIVGDGPLREAILTVLNGAQASELAWLPGARSDVPQLMRSFDAFVLPSLVEGISNTILEAMATGLPVIAARVGGNAELVEDGATGTLIQASDVDALARTMLWYATHPQMARRQGAAGRARAESLFSLEKMVADYSSLYESMCCRNKNTARVGASASEVAPGSR